MQFKYTLYVDIIQLWDNGTLFHETDEELVNIYHILLAQEPNDINLHLKVKKIQTAVAARIEQIRQRDLLSQISALTKIADGQKQFALSNIEETKKINDLTSILVDESKKLGKLTTGLFWLTVILALETIFLVAVEVPEYVQRHFLHGSQ